VAVFLFVEKLKTTTSVPARQGWDRLRGIGSTASVKWGLQASAPDTAAVLATNQADSFPAMNPKRSRSRPYPNVEFHIGAACCHQVKILGDRSRLKQAFPRLAGLQALGVSRNVRARRRFRPWH
jgi:hypothetical protein